MLIKMRVNRSRYRPHHCCRRRTIFVTFLLTILILCLIVRRLFILAWLSIPGCAFDDAEEQVHVIRKYDLRVIESNSLVP